MTLNQIIKRVNELRDHAYDDTIIKGFIEDCDKQIYKEVIETHENKDAYQPYDERYPLDGKDQMLADDAYCELYVYIALAKIDIFNGETDRYTNNMILYNTALSNFKSYYNRTYRPLGVKRIITN